MIGRGVRSGLPGPQHRCQELIRVVAPHAERVEPRGLLEGGRRVLLLAVRDHDRGVHVQHDRLTQVGAGDLRSRDAIRRCGELSPHMTPDPGPRRRDLLQPCSGDLIECSPHRGSGGDRSQDLSLVAHHVDIGDRLTTVRDHHLRFTRGVPSSLRTLRRRNPKFPLLDRHFRVSTRGPRRPAVNDRGWCLLPLSVRHFRRRSRAAATDARTRRAGPGRRWPTRSRARGPGVRHHQARFVESS